MNDFQIKSIAYYLKDCNIINSAIYKNSFREDCYDCYFEFKYLNFYYVDHIQLETFFENGSKITIEEHIDKIKRSISNLKLSLNNCFDSNNTVSCDKLSSNCIVTIISQIDFRNSLYKTSFNLRLQESSLRQKILYLKSHGFNNQSILNKIISDFDLEY